MNNKRVAVFAGSFDPFTIGHYNIVERACLLFDKVIVAVSRDTDGKQCKCGKERLDIASIAVKNLPNVSAVLFDGMLIDFAAKHSAGVVVRGLRNCVDLEYEKSLSEIYRKQNPDIEILHLISPSHFAHISSSIVKELLRHSGSIQGYVVSDTHDKVVEIYR